MKTRRHQILLIQRVLPQFRKEIFRILLKNYGIVVAHSVVDPRPGTHFRGAIKSVHQTLDFETISIGSRRIPGGYYQKIFPHLSGRKLVISHFSPMNLNTYLLPLLKRIYGFKLVYWTHGVTNEAFFNPFGGLAGIVKKWILRSADALLLYDHDRAEMVCRELKMPVFVAQNTLYTPDLDAVRDELTDQQLREERGRLQYDSAKRHILFLGRLTRNKQIPILLDIAGQLRDREIIVHIVGEGELSADVERAASEYGNIVYHGATYDQREKALHFSLADLYVNPGYLGLVVVEIFCYGLPLVVPRMTPRGPFHSPEICYVKDGFNSIQTSGEAVEMAGRIAELLEDRREMEALAANARRTYEEEMGVGNMIRGFDECMRALAPEAVRDWQAAAEEGGAR